MRRLCNSILLLLLWATVWVNVACAADKGVESSPDVLFPSYNGLVMAGYQGWFNTPDDGGRLDWKHYKKGDSFVPGNCTIDLWPEMDEYKKSYKTDFVNADGSAATVFSSRDRSTTDLHFKWMKEYGIDGVFMQRFVTSVRPGKGAENYDIIINSAADCAEKYGRAFCVMYDLSGMLSGDEKIIFDDWTRLATQYKIASREKNHYLHHNGKPLVAVWGVGFDDNRKYNYKDIQKIIDFFKAEGCSLLLGVPTCWRTLDTDTMSDPVLHELIMQADIVHPWLVGRFNNEGYPRFQQRMKEDIAWCAARGKDYVPVLFPGFSWYNLQGGAAAPLNQIPRLKGKFFWRQVVGALDAGAKCMYLAMFDEIDEGTAFFKCTNNPPVGESPFATFEGEPSDHYLWLAGQAARAVRGEIKAGEALPKR